tara:strand:- start:91 stop:579 length:489 start_codon:yes stop_codon:yes gene_type:complete
MCIFIKDYIESNNISFSIIERNIPENDVYEVEKICFKKIFDQEFMLNLDVFDKIVYVANNINTVFITNISTLGRECLGLNRKSFFFSTLLHYYNPDFFDKSSKFFSIEEDGKNFQKKLSNMFELKSDEFSRLKKELKKTVTSCDVKEDKLKIFLDITGLQTK